MDYKPQILVVDDDPLTLELLHAILSENNYKVDLAENEIVALNLYSKFAHEIILMDIALPDSSGFDICNKILSISNLKPSIIFITGNNNSAFINKAFDCGASDYIAKPFDKKELLARINVHTELKKIENRLRQELEHKFLIESELYKYQNTLEEKIIQRTKELQATNKVLQQEIEIKKQTEKELEEYKTHLEYLVKDRTSKLRESEERYRQIFKQSIVAKIMANPKDGRIIEANFTACDLLKYSHHQIKKISIVNFYLISEDLVWEKINQSINNPTEPQYIQFVTGNGDIVDVIVYVNKIEIRFKTFLYFSIFDITELKQNREKIIEQNFELVEKNRQINAINSKLRILNLKFRKMIKKLKIKDI